MTDKKSLKERYFDIVNAIGGVQRDATNPFAKAKYASLSNIQKHLQPLFHSNRCYVVCEFSELTNEVYKCILTLVDVDSDDTMMWVFDIPIDNTQKNRVQAFGATTTYGQRYALCVAFQIALDDTDPDAQPAKGTTGTATTTKPAPQPVQKQVLKKGTEQYLNAVKYLATKEGAKIPDIHQHYIVSPGVEKSLVQDAAEYEPSK